MFCCFINNIKLYIIHKKNVNILSINYTVINRLKNCLKVFNQSIAQK